MKQAIIFIQVLLLSSLNALAQGGGPQSNITGVPVNGFFPHFNIQETPTVTGSRLVQKVHSRFYNSATIAIDSVTYSYKSDSRGGFTKKSDPNNDENILFDESYTYQYNTATGQYDNRMRRTQTFINNDKILSLLYAGWRLSQYADSTQYIYTYTNNLMVESDYKKYLSGSWSTINLSQLDYDIHNNVTSVSSTAYNAKFTYDGSNNLISVKDSQWSQTIGWHYNERKTYTYNGTDVQDYTLEKWDITTSKWVLTKKWQYIYDSNGDIIGAKEFNWNNTGWDLNARNTYTFDNNHNKLTDVRQLWNGSMFINLERESWTYNSFNQPVLIVTDTWNGTAWAKTNNDEQIRFAYEVYYPVSVDPKADKPELSIYPVPSNNNITIDIKLGHPQAITVLISDMNGRVINMWTEQADNYYQKNISVGAMSPGTYFIKLISETGATSNNKFIVIN